MARAYTGQPLRSTRVTRSQSVEAPEPVATPSQSIGNRINENPSLRGIVEESMQELEQDRASKSASVEKDIVELPIRQGRDDESEEIGDWEVISQNDSLNHDDFHRNESFMSGTTAKTTFSQEEISDLDRDVMFDVLPDLDDASQRLVDLLLPNGRTTNQDIWKDIRRNGTPHNKRYQVRMETINSQKRNFGSLEFIKPSIVIRAFLDENSMASVPRGAWRPDHLLAKTNLALMLNSLLITCGSGLWNNETLDALEKLNVEFPETIAAGHFDHTCIVFYLQLATQLAIAKVDITSRKDPNFDPVNIIENVFAVENDPALDGPRATALGLASGDDAHQHEIRRMVDAIVKQLCNPFQAQNTAAGVSQIIAELQIQHPWEGFLNAALVYFEQHWQYLTGQIQANGGRTRILQALQAQTSKHADLKENARRQQDLKDVEPAKLNRFSMSAVKARLKGRVNDVSSPSVSAPTAAMTAPTDARPVHFADDSHAPSHASAPLIGVGETEGGDENNLFQQHAVQTASAPIAQRDSIAVALLGIANRQREERAQINARKRRSTIPLDLITSSSGNPVYDVLPNAPDPTQDEGLQTSSAPTLTTGTSRKRRLPSAFATAATEAPANPRFVHPGTSSRPRPSPPSPTNPGSRIPTLPPLAVESGFITDNASGVPLGGVSATQARELARLKRPVQQRAKPAKQRVAFTPTEENRLVDLIGLIGTKILEGEIVYDIPYSHIKKWDEANGDILEHRNSEALRFKARNLRVSYLLSGCDEPTNFDKVRLDRKAKDKLRSRGIEIED